MPILDRDHPDGPDTLGTDVLNTPVSRAVIEQARRGDRVTLEERDAPLVAILEAVQEFVDDHEYTDGADAAHDRLFDDLGGELESVGAGRAGNAFLDWLWFESSERSLVEARMVGDGELFVVATAEVWAYVADELGLTTSEATAVRDVHNRYAATEGLAGSVGHSLMVIDVPQERLDRFSSLACVEDATTPPRASDGA